MATPQVGETAEECVIKRKRGYQESFIEYGFIEAMDKVRAECIFCRDKLAKRKFEAQQAKTTPDHNQKLADEMTDAFLIKTAYLADIFSLYNETNKRMQAADGTVIECKETVDAFVRKVEYRRNKLRKGVGLGVGVAKD